MAKAKRAAIKIEDLTLTKDDILDVINAIITYWKRAEGRNYSFIVALYGIKAAVLAMNEDLLRVIWSQIIRAFMELYSLSEMKRLAGESPNARFFVDRLIEKIHSGELFEPQN